MKKRSFALAFLLSISSLGHTQDLLAGLGSPLSIAAIPSLDLLGAGLPGGDVVGGLTPLAIDAVNSSLPLLNGVLVPILPLITGISSSTLAGVVPLALDTTNSLLPVVNGVLASGILSVANPLLGSDISGGLLPIAINLINSTAPVLAAVL